MRDAAFREYAVAAEQLVRDRMTTIWSRTRRHLEPEAAQALEEPLADPEATDAPAGAFARQLGDTWVEIEPGIYRHADS